MRDAITSAPVRVFATRDAAEVDRGGLADLAQRVWRHDYAGKVCILYDAGYFEWLLGDADDWIAVIAADAAGAPIGCIVSLLRTLRYAGREFPALYSTAWTVAPEYRNRGVAIRLARAHSAATQERRVGVSLFHAGQAGQRARAIFGGHATVDNTVGTVPFHRAALWSWRVREAEVASPALPCRCAQLALYDGRLHAYGDAPPFDLADYLALTQRAALAFAPAESMARLYLDIDNPRSGTLLLALPGAGRCLVTYSVHELALDDVSLGQVGHLQGLLARDCSAADMRAVLLAACAFLKDQGCVWVTLHAQGGVDEDVLRQVGFTCSDDELICNLWSTDDGFPGFRHLQPPYLLDWI